MDDSLTQSVVDYQKGLTALDEVRNLVLLEAFRHLGRYRRKGEDEVSEFLLQFHGRIEGLLGRFHCQGLPFRHFLLRSLRWQWNSFRADRGRLRRQARLVAEAGLVDPDQVMAEPGGWESSPALTPMDRKRLLLLALKASPWLEERHWEALSRETGLELPWLQACQHRLQAATERNRGRRQRLLDKRGEVFYRRLVAEDDARQEVDPERRQVHERRASFYRTRLTNLARREQSVSSAPTHRDLAQLLGMPKGSVDSSLYHLKKQMASVYTGQDDSSPRDEQPPQKGRA